MGWVAELSDPERETLWNNGVDILARLHQIDWRSKFSFLDVPGPGALGLDRYLGYVERWYAWAAKGRTFEIGETALRYLREHQPTESPVDVLWGDATLGNMLFADDQSVAALLDWEMPALGPGECDLGWWLFMDSMYHRGWDIPRLTGFPPRDETIARYESKLGRPVGDLAYYEILAGLRMMAISARTIDLQIEQGILSPDTTMHTANPVPITLAELLGLPRPELGAEMQQLADAMTRGTVD